MTRVSEAGNNRIVLGVHYPLDIMGGHIAGQYGVATAVSGEKTAQEGAAARAELVDYLTAQCKADNHGDTLDAASRTPARTPPTATAMISPTRFRPSRLPTVPPHWPRTRPA